MILPTHRGSATTARWLGTRLGATVPSALVAVGLGSALGVGAVDAHADGSPRAESEQSVVAELVSSPSPAPGVTARVLPGPVPGILLDATSERRTVTVFGPAGEPYVRLGPRGAEINVQSPTQADAALEGRAPGPRVAPRWRQISGEARYAWLESRARPARLPPVTDGRRRTLVTWRVPLEIDGRRTELRGTTSWVPPPGAVPRERADGILTAFGAPIAVLGALTAVAVAALVAVGRRRRSAAGPPERR